MGLKEAIKGKGIVNIKELRELCSQLAKSSFYAQCKNLPKYRLAYRARLKPVWRKILVNDFSDERIPERSEGIHYLWMGESDLDEQPDLYEQLETYLSLEKGHGRFKFSIKEGVSNDVNVIITSNGFSRNSKVKLKVLIPKDFSEYPSEIGIRWLNGKSTLDLAPNEEEEVRLLKLIPDDEYAKFYEEVRKSLEKAHHKLELNSESRYEFRFMDYIRHLEWRRKQYWKKMWLQTFPAIDAEDIKLRDAVKSALLRNTTTYHYEHKGEQCYEENSFAILVFNVYCEDAFDRKVYVLYRHFHESEPEKSFMEYILYEASKPPAEVERRKTPASRKGET